MAKKAVKTPLSKQDIAQALEEKGVMPTAKRNLTQQELTELQEMQRLVNQRKFEAIQIKANTALIPRGQEVAEELDAIARLLENTKDRWFSSKLIECGYAPGAQIALDLSTGELSSVNTTPLPPP